MQPSGKISWPTSWLMLKALGFIFGVLVVALLMIGTIVVVTALLAA